MDTVALSWPELELRTVIVWPAIVLSAGLHVALLAAMDRPPRRPAPAAPVEMEIVEAPPPPAAPPVPAPAAPEAPAPRVRPAAPRAPRATAPAPAPAPASPAPAVRIGISLDATVAGGGFAVAVGDTALGRTPSVAPRTTQEQAAPVAAPFVPETRLATPPRLLGRADPAYTDDARAAGVEGEMVLLLAIDETGRVSSARVLRGLGHGLDGAAIRAARSFRFAPATAEGRPVRTQIRFTWTFLLD